MTLDAFEAVRACAGNARSQRIHDGTLDNSLDAFTAKNPGAAIGEQAQYYRQLSARLDQADPGTAASPALPFKPPSQG